MVKLGMNVNGEFWKKHICSRIREVGKQVWKNGFNDTEREKEYVQMKECPRNESFVDGNVGAGVRLMVRRCGLVETERHALFECTLYGEERGRWRGVVRNLKDGMEEYEMIKGYHVRSEKNRNINHEISESNVEQ